MEVENNQVQGATQVGNGTAAKKHHKKKANKHKSRNDFSDVQRMELDPVAPPVTTMDLMKAATDLDDLSKKLDERLTLQNAATGVVTNGSIHEGCEEHRDEQGDTSSERQQPNVDLMDSPRNSHNINNGAQKPTAIDVSESGIESDSGPSPANTTSTQSLDVASPKSSSSASDSSSEVKIVYKEYENELQMPDIIRLIQKDLSEPYSIYTYRYFIHNWPELCFLAMHEEKCVGAIVCKLGMHRQIMKRGYIAMLAVDKEYRKLKIGTNLVQKAIEVGELSIVFRFKEF